MENLIFILSVLLNIALIIAVAVYMKRFNNAKKECKEKTNEYSDLKYHYNNLTYENQSLRDRQQVNSEKTNELIQKCNRQNAEIESLQSINNTLLNDNRKLSDELQEIKNKPFDPLKELDNLTIRKEENQSPEAKPKKKQSLKQ
jgi:cell division protein FtsL